MSQLFPTPAELEAANAKHAAERKAQGLDPLPPADNSDADYMNEMKENRFGSAADVERWVAHDDNTASSLRWELEKVESRIVHLLTPELRDLYEQRDLIRQAFRRRYYKELDQRK